MIRTFEWNIAPEWWEDRDVRNAKTDVPLWQKWVGLFLAELVARDDVIEIKIRSYGVLVRFMCLDPARTTKDIVKELDAIAARSMQP